MESNRLKDAAKLLIPAFLGPITLAVVFSLFASDVIYINIPMHALLEMINILVSFSMVALLVLLNDSLKQYIPRLLWLCCAYLTMSIFDLGHIFQDINNNSFWLRCLSTFMGGIFFALMWCPTSRYDKHQKKILVILGICILGLEIYFINEEDFAPLMIENGSWTIFPILMNVTSIICFIASVLYFVEAYLENYRLTSLWVAVSCALYASSCFVFILSSVGNPAWWLFHIIRNMASLILFGLMIYVFNNVDEEKEALVKENAKLKLDLETAIDKQNQALYEKHFNMYREQKENAIEQLAGGLANDFRSLLESINSKFNLLKDTYKEDSFLTEKLSNISTCLFFCLNRTNQLLNVARKNEVKYEMTDLYLLMGEVKEKIESSKNFDLIEYDFLFEETDILAYVDPEKLKNMVMCIVKNAEDRMFTKGKIVLDAYSKSDKQNPEKNWGIIKVIEEGEGLTEEDLESIFDPFYHTANAKKSAGLGLAEVRGAIKDFGGKITAKSKENLGTVFTIEIPKVSSAEYYKEYTKQNLLVTPDQYLKNRKVVLIDSDEDSLNQLAAILKLYTEQVHIFATAHDAKMFMETNDNVDFVIADYFLPDTTGVEFVKDVEHRFVNLKILLLLHYGQKLNVSYLEDHLSTDFMTKPYSTNELLVKLALLSRAVSPAEVGNVIR